MTIDATIPMGEKKKKNIPLLYLTVEENKKKIKQESDKN
jgi:hypothetical protein